MIQNQVAKRQLTFIRKVTRNSDEQLPTNLLMAWCNNKRRVGGVLRSNNKTLVQNIAIIVPTVDQYGSLKLWSHLGLDDRYWKSLIKGIGNAPTPPPGTPTSPNNEREHQFSYPYPPLPSQSPPTWPPSKKITRPSQIPSPREATTPPRARTPIYDTDGLGKTRRYLMDVILLIGRPTWR